MTKREMKRCKEILEQLSWPIMATGYRKLHGMEIITLQPVEGEPFDVILPGGK